MNSPQPKRDLHSPRTANAPHSVYHESFELPEARKLYDPDGVQDLAEFADNFMPDEVTKDFSKRMHYAAYRWKKAKGVAEAARWKSAYVKLRDEVVLGNRKLVYRAVRRRMAMSNKSDDLIGDCQIVLIQAVAAFNPWMGIRFSTYAFTCLVRALARMAQRMSNDWLSRSASLEVLPDGEPGQKFEAELVSSSLFRVDEYLRADHPLLTYREKVIISKRFCSPDSDDVQTLEKVGQDLGLSKERVRQVQASALGKLRSALLGTTA
ncbi:sigma-70 family RNA polymerase sigma factor [Zavarzinella formosa]|uniref:sigma-70 family RNA polymerase sigma factor n=1 Tax=Zavarzinella formosa TaxID=360055 RepID=UPI0003170DC3|nr:sigma-70 family RNA polymerase sigma factor [Zavarzinella formosa]